MGTPETQGSIGQEQPVCWFVNKANAQTNPCIRFHKQRTCWSESPPQANICNYESAVTTLGGERRRVWSERAAGAPLMCNFSEVRASSAPRGSAHLLTIKSTSHRSWKRRSPPAYFLKKTNEWRQCKPRSVFINMFIKYTHYPPRRRKLKRELCGKSRWNRTWRFGTFVCLSDRRIRFSDSRIYIMSCKLRLLEFISLSKNEYFPLQIAWGYQSTRTSPDKHIQRNKNQSGCAAFKSSREILLIL